MSVDADACPETSVLDMVGNDLLQRLNGTVHVEVKATLPDGVEEMLRWMMRKFEAQEADKLELATRLEEMERWRQLSTARADALGTKLAELGAM